MYESMEKQKKFEKFEWNKCDLKFKEVKNMNMNSNIHENIFMNITLGFIRKFRYRKFRK